MFDDPMWPKGGLLGFACGLGGGNWIAGIIMGVIVAAFFYIAFPSEDS